MTKLKRRLTKKQVNELSLMFSMHTNQNRRQIIYKETLFEKIIKKLPFDLWGKFFNYFILRHFYRSEIWMLDACIKELEDYASGETRDIAIKELNKFVNKRYKNE